MPHMKSWMLLASTAVLVACASTPKYMDKVEQQGDIKPLKVQDLLMSSQNDLLRLNIIVENRDDEPVRYRYRVKWTNIDGFQIWDDEPWKPMLIHSHEKQVITVVAPSSKASDFRFVISKEQ